MNKKRKQKETLEVGDLVRVDVMEWNPNWAINGAIGFIREIIPLQGEDREIIQYRLILTKEEGIYPAILYRFELEWLA